jgi:rare lipoprotein A
VNETIVQSLLTVRLYKQQGMMRKYFVIVLIAFSTMTFCSHGKAKAGEPDTAENGVDQKGIASYYGPKQNGRRTADGSVFNQQEMTAAHPWLPFGTRIRVTLLQTGRSVIVTITDRLPSHRRIVDLSVAAARELGIIRQGVAMVSLSPVS